MENVEGYIGSETWMAVSSLARRIWICYQLRPSVPLSPIDLRICLQFGLYLLCHLYKYGSMIFGAGILDFQTIWKSLSMISCRIFYCQRIINVIIRVTSTNPFNCVFFHSKTCPLSKISASVSFNLIKLHNSFLSFWVSLI